MYEGSIFIPNNYDYKNPFLINFLDITLWIDGINDLLVFPDQFCQDSNIGREEGETLQPDEHIRVAA